MKYVFLFLLQFLLNFPGNSQSITVNETRALYPKCTRDKEVCEQLYARLSDSKTDKDIILNGYYGAVAANMANHASEPAQKIKLFNFGRRLIENAVKADSLNLELRFLRFTIQANCPPALHYNKNLEADKIFIINHLESNSNSALQRRISSYLATSKYFTAEEKERVRELVSKE